MRKLKAVFSGVYRADKTSCSISVDWTEAEYMYWLTRHNEADYTKDFDGFNVHIRWLA